MRSQQPRRPPGQNTTFLGGWLFADLLLGALLIFLVSLPGMPRGALEATATPTPVLARATPTPTCERSVALVKQEFDAPNSGSGQGLTVPTVAQLHDVFAAYSGQVAGLVLTYVHAPNPGQGQQLAPIVDEHLRQALPAVFPANAIYEPLDYIDRNPAAFGEVHFQVYFVSKPCP